MKIGIDAREYVISSKGIFNFLYYELDELFKLDKNNEYFLYINTGFEKAKNKKEIKELLNRFTKYKNVKIRDITSPGRYAWEQILLPSQVKKDKLDLLHMVFNRTPFFCNCKTITTVHDLVELKEATNGKYNYNDLRGKFYEWRIKQYWKFMYMNIFKKNDLILTVSEKSKKEIIKELGIKKNKIKTVIQGVDNDFKNTNVKKKHIMTLGGTMSQKNSKGSVEAYSLLPKKIQNKYPLLVIGCDDKKRFMEHLKKYNVKNYILKGFVSKKELIKSYNQAKIFIYLSALEGFGYPPLQAMACGTIPLIYDIEPMKANVKNKGFCVKFKNNKEVAKRIEELIKNKKEYNKLVAFGLKRSKEFTWKNCAKQHLEIYNKVYNNET